jgi:hypothetical protein
VQPGDSFRDWRSAIPKREFDRPQELELPQGRLRPGRILQAMQQSAASALKPNSSSFAGFLAALAAPAADDSPAWNDDDLEDDVATLSYERALRAHARYRPADLCDDSPILKDNSGPTRSVKPLLVPDSTAVETAKPAANPRANAGIVPESTQFHSSASDRNLKTSSITIRLNHAECAQLRKRAADAGLTVSAYLRSCTFEAESLRAQVKEALAQLRAGEPRDKTHNPVSIRRSWLHWPLRSRSGAC